MSDAKIGRNGSPSATILMVDDEPTTLDVMEMFLRNEGYRSFIKTGDARRTLELIRSRRPDVTLLNLRMPHVSGLEVLRAMRIDESLRDLPVIIVTSSTDSETKQMALESGAADFLCKPIDPSELALRVRNTLAARSFRDGWKQDAADADDEALEPIVSRLSGGPRSREILETFTRRLREKIAEMESCFASGSFDELVSLAHWLKGAAGTVGYDAFTEPAERLRQAADDRKPESVEPLLERLRDMTDRIQITALEDA